MHITKYVSRQQFIVIKTINASLKTILLDLNYIFKHKWCLWSHSESAKFNINHFWYIIVFNRRRDSKWIALASIDVVLSSVPPQQEFPASRCRSERGPERSGSRLRHRHRGRRRRSRHRPAAPALRGHDPHLDLRRGAGALRPHRGSDPIYKIDVRIKTPSHSFHIKAARTNRRFSLNFHYTPWVWQDRMASETCWCRVLQ